MVRREFPNATVIKFPSPKTIPVGKRGVHVEVHGVVALDFDLNGCGPVVGVPFYVTRELEGEAIIGAETMQSLGIDIEMRPDPQQSKISLRHCPPNVRL